MMKWTALSLSCLLLVSSALTTTPADPGVSSAQENKSQKVDSVPLFTRAKPAAAAAPPPPPPPPAPAPPPPAPAPAAPAAGVREGALLLLKDYTDQGDTLLKERLKDSYSNLKDMLKQGDAALKERMAEGVTQLKEQRKEGDERLKEELKEDVAWLKGRLAEGQTRMKEELAEEEAETKEQLAGQKDSLDTLKASVQGSIHMMKDDLKQQMSDFKEELKNTKLQLQSTQETLQSTQETLQSTRETLQSTQTDLQSTQDQVRKTEEDVQQTREQLQKEEQTSTELKNLLQAAEGEISSLKDHSRQCSHRLDVLESSDRGEGHRVSGDSGSTFIRWGRTTCPDNTSLVYAGIAGGSSFNVTGGGSNYLCLVSDPQLDNMTLPKYYSSLQRSEYEHIGDHHDHDVVCSVCRAPQPTSIMIPAKLTCPEGWTIQYRGHLVAGYQGHKGRAEYVCLDEVREHGVGGRENRNGALMYLVVSTCTNLPCPPYAKGKIVTCVVCSM